MCAIPQLVSAPLNPIPTAEHFRRSHPRPRGDVQLTNEEGRLEIMRKSEVRRQQIGKARVNFFEDRMCDSNMKKTGKGINQ